MDLFELNILNAISRIRNPTLDWIMKFFSLLGEWGALFIILTILMLAVRKTRRAGITCTIALALNAFTVNIVLKPLVSRLRPFFLNGSVHLLVAPPTDFSFPSGHASLSFAFATALSAYDKRYCIFAYILASLISFSRLYLYVHYPSDVLAGAVIGIICGLTAKYLMLKKLKL